MSNRYKHILLGLLFILITHSVTCAEETGKTAVALPENGLWANTNFIIWVDIQALTRESIDDTKAALEEVGIINANAITPEALQEYEAGLSDLMLVRNTLFNEGVDSLVVAFTSSDLPVSVTPDQQPAQDAAGQEALDAEDEKLNAQYFLHTRPGVEPARIKDALNKILESYERVKAEDLDHIRTGDIRAFSDGWCIMINDEMSAPPSNAKDAADEADVARFLECLIREHGASLRAAWIMNSTAKQQINELLLEPGAFLLMGVIQPLTSLDSGSIGVWPGTDPKFRLSMQFTTPESAEQFQTGINSLLMMITNLTAFAANANEATPEQQQMLLESQEQMKVMMSLLMFDRQGANLSKTIDSDILKRMVEVGITTNADAVEPDEPGQDTLN